MTATSLLSILGGLVLLSGCLSNTPTKTLTGAASDPVAAAQRAALGLGDMAEENADSLPDLTATSFTGIGSGLTALNASNISSGTLANARTSALSTNTANAIVVRDVSGDFAANSVTLTGDLAVNGGDLTTTATTFNLLNAAATTINFAGAATTLTMGSNSLGLRVPALGDAAGTPLEYGILFTNKNGVFQRSNLGTSAGFARWNGTSAFTVDTNTYAPLNAPSFTGGVSIAGGATVSSGDLTVSSGNLNITGNQQFSGDVARTLSSGRTNIGNGNTLTVQAGGGQSGSTDRLGGNLILSGGISTGTGSSSIQFQTATASSTGSTDRTPTTKLTLDGSGILTFAQSGGLSMTETPTAAARMGIATLAAGTVTVSTTAIKSNSRVFLTIQDPNGGTPGAVYVSARVASTSFTITSTSGTDTSQVAWLIIDPAP